MSNHASRAVRRRYRWQYDADGIRQDGIAHRAQRIEHEDARWIERMTRSAFPIGVADGDRS
jgi:hypothetical protein